MDNSLPNVRKWNIITGKGCDTIMGSNATIDREKVILEIIAAIATLEKCGDKEIESVKRFLRWMPDNALLDMRDKHREALRKMMAQV